MIPFGVNDNIKYLPLSFSIYILDVITFSCVSKALAEILKPTDGFIHVIALDIFSYVSFPSLSTLN